MDIDSSYRLGRCAELAIALHRHTGLPIELAGFDHPETDDEDAWREDAHAFVRLPNHQIADIDGARDEAEMLAALESSYQSASPRGCRTVGVEEAWEAFTSEAFDEAAIGRAVEAVPRVLARIRLAGVSIETLADPKVEPVQMV